MKRIITILLFFVCSSLFAQESKPAFWDEIQKFKQQDSLQKPPAHALLFVGSSSFTKWTDVQNYFPGYTIINRGFGGSRLTDLIRYEQEVIFEYKPKQIIIYCGENDMASSDTITAVTVYARFKELFTDIRQEFPNVPIVYISMKPSPSRWHLKDKLMAGNELIRKYLKKQKHAKFVSIWNAMLGPDGKPWDALFLEDNLHMNANGYAIWQKILKPYLLKN